MKFQLCIKDNSLAEEVFNEGANIARVFFFYGSWKVLKVNDIQGVRFSLYSPYIQMPSLQNLGKIEECHSLLFLAKIKGDQHPYLAGETTLLKDLALANAMAGFCL